MHRILCAFAAALLALAPLRSPAQEAPPPEVATASLESTGRATRWENWAFAGGILAAAAIGMTFIVLNQGTEAR